jgi:DNA modification methylase
MAVQILTGDCLDVLRTLPDGMAQTCVTSPPYFGLRDYGMPDQIGLEPTPGEFVSALVAVFREVWRVLRDDGTVWLNLGDSYSTESKWGGSTSGKSAAGVHGRGGGGRAKARHGIPDKNLLGIPWRVAFALQSDGWYLRQDIIWHKPNPMPESVTDRCTKAHEYVFLFSKTARYFFDAAAIAEPVTESSAARLSQPTLADHAEYARAPGKTNGNMKAVGNGKTRNRRSVWTIATQPFRGAHFATMPPELAKTCIKAGTKPGDMVLDPFGGAGTTGLVADRLQRNATLIELNPAYATMARNRIDADAPMFGGAA